MDKNIIQKIILENQELVEQVELVERHFFLSLMATMYLLALDKQGNRTCYINE